jgi:drug/metabolite transporter (DMT)-like permease
MLMFFEGLSRTSPIDASLIMVTTPILVVILGFIVKEEKFNWTKVFGILLGTGSASMLILSKGNIANGSTLLGDIFIFINAASYAIFLVIVRPLMKKYHPITIMTWTFFFGSFFVAPFGYRELSQAHWMELNLSLWAAVGFTLLCTTFIAYILNAYALKHVASSVVGSYVYLQPVLGIFIAVSTGKYILHLQQLGYALLIFAGVYLVSKTEKIS